MDEEDISIIQHTVDSYNLEKNQVLGSGKNPVEIKQLEIKPTSTSENLLGKMQNMIPFIIENFGASETNTINTLSESSLNSFIGKFISSETDDLGEDLPIIEIDISGETIQLLIGSTHNLYETVRDNNLVGRFVQKDSNNCTILWCEDYPEKLL